MYKPLRNSSIGGKNTFSILIRICSKTSPYWDTPVFRSNLNYLKKEFGDAFEEEPEMAKALRLPPGGKVYATPIMNLTYYIQYIEGQPPKVIFLSPLAW